MKTIIIMFIALAILLVLLVIFLNPGTGKRNNSTIRQDIDEAKLQSHLLEIQETAQSRLEHMVNEMAKASGITEALKAENQLAWVGQMNMIRMQAEETILTELIRS